MHCSPLHYQLELLAQSVVLLIMQYIHQHMMQGKHNSKHRLLETSYRSPGLVWGMFFSPALAFRGDSAMHTVLLGVLWSHSRTSAARREKTSPFCSPRLGVMVGTGVSLLAPLWDLLGQCGRQGWKLNFQMTTFETHVRKGYSVCGPALSGEKP